MIVLAFLDNIEYYSKNLSKIQREKENYFMNRNLNQVNRIVVKIGTSSLTYPSGALNFRQIEQLCAVTTNLQNSGKEVIIVSSGAIGAGMGRLGLKEKPTDLDMKQACAAIGQAYLIQIYQHYFSVYHQLCAQVLLTKDVVDDAIGRTNVIRTFSKLLDMGVIPIVNENDTVSTDEIEGVKFSDNDNLSAVVSSLITADLFIILSDIEGLRLKVDGVLTNEVIGYVDTINDDVYENIGEQKSCLGTGGMASKIKAIETAVNVGVDAVICSSKDMNIIYEVLEGKAVGTFFKGRNRNG